MIMLKNCQYIVILQSSGQDSNCRQNFRKPGSQSVTYRNNKVKGVPAKTRPPETLNYSKSKTCTAKKLNLYQPVYPISYTGWCSFLSLQVLDLEQFKVSGDLIYIFSVLKDSTIMIVDRNKYFSKTL